MLSLRVDICINFFRSFLFSAEISVVILNFMPFKGLRFSIIRIKQIYSFAVIKQLQSLFCAENRIHVCRIIAEVPDDLFIVEYNIILILCNSFKSLFCQALVTEDIVKSFLDTVYLCLIVTVLPMCHFTAIKSSNKLLSSSVCDIRDIFDEIIIYPCDNNIIPFILNTVYKRLSDIFHRYYTFNIVAGESDIVLTEINVKLISFIFWMIECTF